MNIFTSYFANVKNLPLYIMPVSIALYPPRGWKYGNFKILAPTKGILDAYKRDHDEAEYRERYKKILERVSSAGFINWLKSNYVGDIALICYERPGTFCHRHLVAEWLKADGIPCEEWEG